MPALHGLVPRLPAALALAIVSIACGVVAAGCESIAGIEDRELSPLDGGGSAASPECQSYCKDVMARCTGTYAVYAKEATCLGLCKYMAPGDPLEPSGNTLACRALHAGTTAAFEPDTDCPAAGPGGGGICGDNCEAYCSLLPQVCPSEAGQVAGCAAKCAALRDAARFDAIADHDGDTVQCRLVHTSSATIEPATHCAHAKLIATTPCTNPPETVPTCDEYCGLAMAACTGALAVYESVAQCKAVCAALPVGLEGDTTSNTVGCRRYHSYNAMAAPATHCSHVSPSGDGHCGLDATGGATANCVSYCQLLQAGCSAEFTATFADQDACTLACAAVPGAPKDAKYDLVAAATGNTVQCRLLHVARALETPATAAAACQAAIGQGDCAP